VIEDLAGHGLSIFRNTIYMDMILFEVLFLVDTEEKLNYDFCFDCKKRNIDQEEKETYKKRNGHYLNSMCRFLHDILVGDMINKVERPQNTSQTKYRQS
jgi:hypothetical protein